MGNYLAIIGGLGGMFGWGVADFCAKKVINKLGDFRTLLWAQIIGVFPIFVYLGLNWKPILLDPSILFLIFLFGLADLSAYFLFYRSLQKGMVSVLSSVFAAQSGVAVLVSVFVFGEAIGQLRWIELAIAFVGIILVSFQPEFNNSLNFKNISKGLPEAMGGMIIFGFYFPCWDWFLESLSQSWAISVLLVRLVLIIILLVSIYIISLTDKRRFDIKVKEKKLWGWLVLIGLLDALASLITSWAYKSTAATSVVVTLSGAFPLPAIILARLFLKERLSINQIIGVVGIIGGLIALSI